MRRNVKRCNLTIGASEWRKVYVKGIGEFEIGSWRELKTTGGNVDLEKGGSC